MRERRGGDEGPVRAVDGMEGRRKVVRTSAASDIGEFLIQVRLWDQRPEDHEIPSGSVECAARP